MLPEFMVGTRQRQNSQQLHPVEESITRSFAADPGMSKRVVASCTFVGAGTNQIQAAGGTFANFTAGDVVMVEGTNRNNGIFKVLSTDASTQLTVDNGLHAEGPVSTTVRTL